MFPLPGPTLRRNVLHFDVFCQAPHPFCMAIACGVDIAIVADTNTAKTRDM